MKHPIHPAKLKMLRKRHGLSQERLTTLSEDRKQTVSIATIKRIETSAETYMASTAIAQRLSQILRVEVEELGKAPDKNDPEKQLYKARKRELRKIVSENTLLASQMVEKLYGISTQAQIEMAPLCMALLAEGSLAWRKERLSEIEEKAQELYDLGDDETNFSFVHAVDRVQESALYEKESIKNRDLFGKEVAEDNYKMGYMPDYYNPFTDYLCKLAQDYNELAQDYKEKEIIFELSQSIDDIGVFGFPSYKIGANLMDEIIGGNSYTANGLYEWSEGAEDSDDLYALYALARGHVKLADIPADLLGADNTEKRVEWIISHIPEDERSHYVEELKKPTFIDL